MPKLVDAMQAKAIGQALIVAAGITASAAVQAGDSDTGAESAEVLVNAAPAVDAHAGYFALNWNYRQFANLINLFNIHPVRPILRSTEPVTVNDNKHEATGRSNVAVGNLTAKLEAANRVVPYLGVGWGSVASARFNFYADVGVVLLGSGTTADCTWLNPGQCQVLQNQSTVEQAALDDTLRRFKASPALNLGLAFGF